MVEAGDVTVRADMDTSELERGVDKSKQKLKELGDTANSVEIDTKKLGNELGRIGRGAAAAATTAAGFFGGIAAQAPATAGSVARIKVAAGKFVRETGEDISPLVSKAATGLEKTQEFFAADPVSSLFQGDTGFQEKFSGALADVGGLFTGENKLKDLFKGSFFSDGIKNFFEGRKNRESRNEADLN